MIRVGPKASVAAAFLVLSLATPGHAAALPLRHPTLTTAAPPTSPVGSPLTDTAILGGGSSSIGGTLIFSVFGPADPTCAGAPTALGAVAVNGNGTYTSPPFTPTTLGLYHFQASYSGDALNQAVPPTSACLEIGELTLVVAAKPSLRTKSSAAVPPGGTITDTATLAGAYNPGGTITFKLYGAADPGCAGTPVFSSTKPVADPTVSAAYAPPDVGAYHWIAAYNGDPNNLSVAGKCGEPDETATVSALSTPSVTAIVLEAPKPTSQGLTPAGGCVPAEMARALARAIAAALTGKPGSAFRATCGGGVRIVLRAREIRPGFTGTPRHDGYTTIGDTLTNVPANGQIAFTINSGGVALRRYAKSIRASLLVFAIVHVKTSREPAAESIRVFSVR